MTQKRVLITGGSRGLGLEVARLLAADGYVVTLVARDADSLAAVVRSLPGDGHRSWVVDLSQPGPTRELLNRLADEPFDLLINNAGASRFGALTELSPQAVEELLYLNLTAPALLSYQFVRLSRPGATLVNVTSIVGTVPVPGNSLYCAAKSGLQTLSECLWFEARAKGVRVLDFRPVSLKTDFHRLAGSASMAGAGLAVDPAVAARDLVRAIAGGRDFVYAHGTVARLLGIVNRLLPRRFVIRRLGQKSTRAGYLSRAHA